MKTASELRAEARASLSPKWGEAIVLSLIFIGVTIALNVINNLISFIAAFIPFIGTIFTFALGIVFALISVILSYGFTFSFIKLKRNDNFSYGDFFTLSYQNFSKILSVLGNTILKLWLPLVLFVASFVFIILGAIFMAVSANTSTSSDSSNLIMIMSILVLIVGYVFMIASSVFLVVRSYYYALTPYLLYDNPNMTAKEIVELSESLMKGQRASLFLLQLSFIGWIILSAITCGIGTLFLNPYMEFATIGFYEDRANVNPISNNT